MAQLYAVKGTTIEQIDSLPHLTCWQRHNYGPEGLKRPTHHFLDLKSR